MKKSELINGIAQATGYKKSDINEVINALRDVVWDALKEKEDIRLIDGITIKALHVNPRTYNNPRTGELIETPAKYLPKARFSSKLKKFINE